MKQHKPLKVIISGGGTGGHIFPAIAIANALKDKVDNIRILFVGAKNRMEMTMVPEAGYHIIGLNIAGLQRRFTLKNLAVPFKLIDSIISSDKIVRRFNPDMVIGVGGYASGPVVRSAIKSNIPTLIQEQNSYPGITNRVLGKKVNRICVAYQNMEKFFPKDKIYLTGNPVRQNILEAKGKRDEGLKYFNFSTQQKVLMISGGSLGARSINQAIENCLELLISNKIQIIWQTGKYFFDSAQETAKRFNYKDLKVMPFIDKMEMAYAAADLVVSRAGAITVSEIALLQKPAILVPSPNVAEDHQTKNALALVNINAAILVKDDQAGEKLGSTIVEVIFNEKKLYQLQEKIQRLASKDAASNIAGVALSMIN